MMRLPRWGLACALAGVVGAAACSAPSKGALVLAISTDMRTPKDINVVSVFITSDSVVKFDYLGRVLPDGTVALPATLAIVEPDKPDAKIRIRVIAFEEQNARVLRDVLTTVPHQQTSLLRLPLSFLDDGSGKGTIPPRLVPLGAGGAPEGETSFEAESIASSCDFTRGLTSINGECVSAVVDSSSLPAYVPTEVYGEGGLQPSGAPTSCFDVGSCLRGAMPVMGVDMQSCSVQVPAGVDPASINVALVTSSTGECLAPGQCYVPLENDPGEGWAASGGTIKMVAGVCAKIAQGAQLYVQSGACAPKAVSEPVCEPTAPGAGSDSGAVPDASGCDGDYVVTCLSNASCGKGSGGAVAVTVAGAQATVFNPDHSGQNYYGTVDLATCSVTVTVPPPEGGSSCDLGATVTLDLSTGTTSGVPCSTSTFTPDGSFSCSRGMMTCTVARGVLEAGAFDAGPGGPVDATVSSGAIVNGSIDGIGLPSVTDQAVAAGLIDGSQGAVSVMGILLSDTAGVCPALQVAQTGGAQKASSTQLALAMATGGSTPIGPGTYSITTGGVSLAGLGPGQMWAVGTLTQMSATCSVQPNALTGGFPDSQARSGSITVTQVTPSAVSGSFNLIFNTGTLSGTFSAPICSGVNLQQAFTTSGGLTGPGPDINGICYASYGGDAGAPDAAFGGTDAGFGGGPDASFDGSPDAGSGGGTDATFEGGPDASVTDAGPPPGCYLLPAGAVSWWRGEGNANDVLATNPAAWTGPASYGAGMVGQAFTFAGASYLASSVTGINPATGGTIEGWVQVNNPSATADLFGFGLTTMTMDGGGVVSTGLGSTWRPDFLYGTQTIQGTSLNAAQWTHIALTWAPPGDGGIEDVTLYVDGVPFASAPIDFTDAGTPVALLMGGEGAGTAYLTGLLDEVTLYNVPLAGAQIQGIFNAGGSGKCQCQSNTDCPAPTPSCVSGFCQ